MLACGNRETRRWPLYSGTKGAAPMLAAAPPRFRRGNTDGNTWRLFRRGLLLPASNSIFSKGDADVEQTGSITQTSHQATDAANAVVPSETDLVYARAIAADAVALGSKDSSVPWENPHTGAGGNITPLAAALHRRQFHLPRFPGELRARASASLVGGRGLPHRARQVGSKEPETPQAGLIAVMRL